MKNRRTPLVLLGVLLGNSKETRQSLGFLSFSLLFLSLPSPFFLYPLSPTSLGGYHQLNPFVWSTKGAKGGLKVPPFLLNRLEHLYFFALLPESGRPFVTHLVDRISFFFQFFVSFKPLFLNSNLQLPMVKCQFKWHLIH